MTTETIKLVIVGLACAGLSWCVTYMYIAERSMYWMRKYNEERDNFDSARRLHKRTLDNSIKIAKENQRLRRSDAQLLSHRGLRGGGK